MADGQRAALLRDGKLVEWISLEEARQTAERLGLSLPPRCPPTITYYEGEYNAAAEPEGHGIMRYAGGGVYEGEWKAGLREGRGVERYANGTVRSCFFKHDAPVGEGVMWDNFDTDAAAKGYHPKVTCDRSGMSPIVGIRYNLIGDDYDLCEAEFEKLSADLKPLYQAIRPGQRTCLRLRDGDVVEYISLEEARQTAERLGLPIPSPLPGE